MEGSPPRMRGKVDEKLVDLLENRITPAYAGKSFPALLSGLRRWDHPRVCGEKAGTLRQRNPVRGSPPRMRGKD